MRRRSTYRPPEPPPYDIRREPWPGSIAAIAGVADDPETVRVMVQQCFRDMHGVGSGAFEGPWFTATRLYEQLTGVHDPKRVTALVSSSWMPENEGSGAAPRLSAKAEAELRRKELYD